MTLLLFRMATNIQSIPQLQRLTGRYSGSSTPSEAVNLPDRLNLSTNEIERASVDPDETDTANDLPAVSQRQQWTVLLSAFLTVCITIGFNQSYGVLQAAYASPADTILTLDQLGNGALIAFVGTLGAGLTWAGGVVVNPLMARVPSMRYITLPGVIMMSLGFGLASLGTQVTLDSPIKIYDSTAATDCFQIWHLLLTEGLLYGIGSSFLYFPILSVCPEYFTTRRGAAMGFILSGAGIGAMVLSPITRALIAAIGIRWTLRFLAFLNLAISLPIALTAPPSRFTSRRPTRLNLQLALKPAFLLSLCASALQSSGNLIPLTFLSEFSIALGYSASFGAALIAINSGINSASRILTGFAGDAFGRQNMLVLTTICSAVAVVGLWLSSAERSSPTLWILFVVFYGVWAGGYN